MTEIDSNNDNDPRVDKAIAGDEAAMVELFDAHRERLKRMVELRMDRRLQGRVDASDVLQDTYVDLARQLSSYAQNPTIPFFIWLRRITGQRLTMLHRRHLGAAKRDPNLEMAIHRGGIPEASSFCLASKLVGQFTSASHRVMRDERQAKLQEILDEMNADDRDIIGLRHFEHLSIGEIATLLEISEPAAGMRHLRALRRLKQQLSRLPELFDSLADFGNEVLGD